MSGASDKLAPGSATTSHTLLTVSNAFPHPGVVLSVTHHWLFYLMIAACCQNSMSLVLALDTRISVNAALIRHGADRWYAVCKLLVLANAVLLTGIIIIIIRHAPVCMNSITVLCICVIQESGSSNDFCK